MNPEKWRLAKDIFLRACDLPRAERSAKVDEWCEGDLEIKVEVERLLGIRDDDDDSFLEPPTTIRTPDEPTPPPDESALRIPDFVIEREIGRGGMGIVYLARDEAQNRMVAIKVLPSAFDDHSTARERFEREARAAMRLSHPHVIRVHRVGESARTPYFVMDYIDGHDLAKEIQQQRRRADGKDAATLLPPVGEPQYMTRVVALCADAAEALNQAHQLGIVHRDIKPQNLLLRNDGHVFVGDFGLARDEAFGTITRDGELMGSLQYMSPEQANAARGRIDLRTDVYSLGVVLYEMLTLKRPFEGTTDREILDQLKWREPPTVRSRNPRVPRDLEVICATAMAKDRTHRYSNALDFAKDLRRFLSNEAIVAKPPALAYRVWQRTRRYRIGIAAAVVLVTAVVVARNIAVASAMKERAIGRVAELRRILGDGGRNAGALDASTVSLCKRIAGEIEVDIERLDPDDRSFLAAARESLGARVVAFQVEASKLIEQAAREQDEEIAKTILLRAYRALHEAALLSDSESGVSDPELLARLRPTVEVHAVDEAGNPIGAFVSYRTLDPISGRFSAKLALGQTPFPPTHLSPGQHRIVVEFTDGGFREYTRRLQLGGGNLPIVATRRSDEDRLTTGMVRFPAAHHRFPDASVWHCPQRGQEFDLESYWLAETEVSNAEYKRFVDATGATAPLCWGLGYPEDRASHAVAGVSFEDAQAYAEWAGLRLPTHAEWEHAARGAELRHRPWAAEIDARAAGANVFGPVSTSYASLQEAIALYRDNVWDVRSAPGARSPEGLYHLYGNVDEITESPGFSFERDVLKLLPNHYVLMGGAFDAVGIGFHFDLHSVGEKGASHAQRRRGLRCAKSVQP